MAEKLAHDLEWIADRSVPLYLRTLIATAAARRSRQSRAAGSSRRQRPRLRRVCGICGIVSLDGSPSTPNGSRAMSATLVHRGPDSDGAFVDGPVGLAARRLAIIDLETRRPADRERGRHASTSSRTARSTTTASCARELERAGHRFRTHGDTEVLVHLYEERGPRLRRARCAGCSRSRSGTRRARRLVLARDRFGIKPLYYRVDGGELAFASELRRAPARRDRPRRARGVPRLQLDPGAADDLPRGAQAAARPPAGLGGRRGRRLERYARPAPAAADELRDDDEAELVEELRARLRDSVRAHLVSDVPVGVLLSGGVDSAALAALAARGELRAGAHVLDRLRGALLRRARRARALVAERYGTRPPRARRCGPTPALLLPALAEAFDEPFADSSALPTYLVSQLAAEDVKVALSGEGGDELFGGYYTYVADLLADARRPGSRALARPLVERLPSSTAQGELRLQGEALRPRARTCRRSSATTAGRRSSRPTRAPS